VPPDPAQAGPVHVSIQWRGPRPAGSSRADRKAALAAELRPLLEPDPRVHVDWDSISLAAQTVEATLDARHADSAVADLQAQGLRVDPVVDRKIID
jgi:hypothetical protein